jgi:hypothetical protein
VGFGIISAVSLNVIGSKSWSTPLAFDVGNLVQQREQLGMRFANWCDQLHLTMAALRPSHVAAYIEKMSLDAEFSPPTVKQHLSAIRMLFDWLVIGQANGHARRGA